MTAAHQVPSSLSPRPTLPRPQWRWFALVLLANCWATAAASKEPYREFLEGLRQRGLHEVSLSYLAWAAESPLVAADDKAAIPLERGLTLMELARLQTDPQQRTSQLDEARAQFQQFLAAAPQHPSAATARTQLGNVLVERARVLVDRSRRPQHAAQQEELLAEARGLLEQGQQVFTDAQQQYQQRLDDIGRVVDEKDRAKVEARRQALLDLMQAKLFAARVLSELGHTYPADSDEFKQWLTQAAERYGEFYERYRRVLGGLQARLSQGRCLQELGNPKQALSYYEELLAQPDEQQESRSLKAKALRFAMQCWTSPELPQWDEAIRRGRSWLEATRDDDQRNADTLGIRWLLAYAAEHQARALAENDNQRDRLRSLAIEQASIVARVPGDDQAAAKQLLAKLQNRELSSEPTNFTEARQQAQAQLDTAEAAAARLVSLPADDPQRADTQSEITQARAAALKGFRLALQLADDETSLDDVNQVRYFLCYLYYQSGRHHEAAILGEFLARHYSAAAGARPAASIAVAAYVQIYNAAAAAQRASYTAQLVSLATFITATWPEEPDADRAWMILGDMALREGRTDDAIELLAHVPEASPRRAEADLKAGQALWSLYLSQPPAATTEQPTADRAPLRQQAQQLLQRGLQSARDRRLPLDYALVAAELSFVQLLVESSQHAEAVTLLERPTDGLLALLNAKHPLLENGNLALETAKVALQAYVGQQQLEKAEGMMAALEARTGGDDAGQTQLTRVYVGLGRQLQSQLERLRQSQDQAAVNRVLDSFKTFLDKIAGRTSGLNFSTLNWVAETYAAMGAGLAQGDQLSAEARNYLEKAAASYQRLITESAEKPDFAPQGTDVLPTLTLRQARCLRQLGRPDEAIDLLVDILKRKPASLEAQIEAATCYQAWGAREPARYASAIQGDRPAKRPDGSRTNIVWGWKKLVTTLQGNPQFTQQYYSAYLQLAECSLRQALAQTPPQQTASLKMTQAVIQQLARTDPEMGGPQWRPQFDALFKQVQQALGQKPQGIEAAAPSSVTNQPQT